MVQYCCNKENKNIILQVTNKGYILIAKQGLTTKYEPQYEWAHLQFYDGESILLACVPSNYGGASKLNAECIDQGEVH
jgi:hypothetical protein